ncbi:MAG TPA: extracellular solute-binding protein [Actinomycetota bacterium]|nr:extracellular solute-binding protein [Actinomycetota bacterium]
MRYRWKSLFALATVLGLVAVACGGGKAKTTPSASGSLAGTTITFSDSLAESEVAAVQDLLTTFQDQTGVTVKLTAVTAADLPQKLSVEVDSGQHTIQLFAQDNLALATLVDQDLVEDLSDIQIPPEITPALIPQKFDGKQYFLPYRPNVRVTYVNTDRFSAAGVSPPQTVEDYKAVAEKLKAAGGSGKVTLSLADQPDTGPLGVTVSEWVVSYGGDPLILNDSGSVQAFTFLQGMWKEGDFAKESRLAKYDTEVDYLKGETSWMATNWPFTTAELAGADILDKFNVYEGWKGPARAAHVIGGEVLGIPKGVTGKQKDAAIALAQFLTSKDAQTVLVSQNSWPSVRSDALGEVPSEQKSTFDAIQVALADGWYRPNVVYWSDVEAAMDDAVTRIIYSGEDATTVLNEEHNKIAHAAKSKGATYPPTAT